jgi:hypothetical protein
VGIWARNDAAFAWLASFLTVETFHALVPDAAGLDVNRYEFPNLRALNFVVVGLLGEGVSSSTRFDAQAKSLGEYLRSRVVDLPEGFVGRQRTDGKHCPYRATQIRDDWYLASSGGQLCKRRRKLTKAGEPNRLSWSRIVVTLRSLEALKFPARGWGFDRGGVGRAAVRSTDSGGRKGRVYDAGPMPHCGRKS